MVPHFGKHESRQRIYLYGLQDLGIGETVWIWNSIRSISRGKIRKQVASNARWWLVEMVVLSLMESLPTKGNYHVFMDNYFASLWLLVHLGEQDIRATGVINKKKLNKCRTMGDKALKKNPRGQMDQRKSTNWVVCGITVTGLNANRAVYFASN